MQTSDHNSVWATCPADILLMILQKLDLKSIINCMDVNTFWRSLVEYYCEKANLWKAVVQYSIEDVKFTEKNILGWKDQFLSAQQWLNANNVNVSLQNHNKLDNINNISVYRDNLIVVTDVAVKYFDIENFKVLKTIERSCLKYEETSTLVAELSSSDYITEDYPRTITMNYGLDVLTLTNKIIKENFDSGSVEGNIYVQLKISLFKVHLNACYALDIKNVLWMYTANANGWDFKALAKYYGNRGSICSIHIHKKNVYVLSKRGDVFLIDMECKKFEKVFHLHVPLNCLDSELLFFHPFTLLINAPNAECRGYVEIYAYKQKEFVLIISRHGISCVLEHGHALLLGYEDGKIEIYLTKKLTESSEGPELEIHLQNCLDKTNQLEKSLRINSLDVYEDKAGHHLFVATHSDVYELLLC
ncbi:jg9451 [Pararge aegeria aegeria]|uniref:Jg9451 protein n=1 Tax=Pararge aegeria aegeria TaxID=348720 RepID=A0A8S4RHR8_9NEOP|nr:jg9451 [Pararge aegeria aegeria]